MTCSSEVFLCHVNATQVRETGKLPHTGGTEKISSAIGTMTPRAPFVKT